MSIRAVHWHEGMFLRPHHFQTLHRHWLELNHRNERLDVSYFWGLRTIDLDPEALANYRFEVHALTARLRDGTVVAVPADGALSAVELKAVFEQHRSVT